MLPNTYLQVAAVEALTAVVESQLVSGHDVVDLLLPSVLANINVVATPDEVCTKQIVGCGQAQSASQSGRGLLQFAPNLWLDLHRWSMPG